MVAATMALAGCVAQETELEGSLAQTVNSDNRLSVNRLSVNQLALHSLSISSLTISRYQGNRLALNTTSSGGLENTQDGRETLTYLARCAFRANDILVAKDQYGATHEFPGLLGLATSWEFLPLTELQRQLVSACLFAHVNAYGVSVPISVRSAPWLAVSPEEKRHYAVLEGVFFGQAFVPDGAGIKPYACQGDDATLALIHSAARSQRACTDSNASCNMVVVGRCRDVCTLHTPGEGWKNCTVTHADGTTEQYLETVSIYLYADNPDGANQTCSQNSSCTLTAAADRAAIHGCTDSASCTSTCGARGQCIVNAPLSDAVRATAEAGALTQIDCMGTSRCAATCRDGASCEIDCKGALDCTAIQCEGNADCLLSCDDTAPGTCQFSTCAAGRKVCPGNITVCGRNCP